ncbi:hypothetical protein VPHK392_0030 [Vibrio phage K392]
MLILLWIDSQKLRRDNPQQQKLSCLARFGGSFFWV